MRGVVFLGDRRLRIQEFADPEPGPGEVVVRMMATGICGSDLHVYRRGAEEFRDAEPTIVGHEPSGVVEALGPGVTRVKPGDRVCVNHYRSCGHCRHCAEGFLQWCADARGYGGPVHGSHGDLLLADERNCVVMPDEVSFVDGAFVACAGGTAYSGLRKLDVSGQSTLTVMGLGPVGLSAVLIGKAFGARVIGVDVIEERVALARKIGADEAINGATEDVVESIRALTGGEGSDALYEASGSAPGRRQGIQGLRRGGAGVFCGVGTDEETLNLTEIIGRELTLMGSFVLSLRLTYDLVQFLADNQLSFDPLVTHTFPIADGEEAYREADESRTGKVAFTW
ncbi:alcohol dehydrogenase catalytic domain-containing protein [Candidatus Poribacteria bacterium]|jgi:threonine dehydrogenase-like Zn-dependent dehydrogenase|nr:alcohol dehydrogenase catalytic domain-containing protein [Candidatus Poribacteria bacterium]MBT5709958.1 alcohol dehydrogenase catalytic domain-containing protein [Candidatus Poribacteria bacterium]MBT7100415.1 alcohol dehydrogenase catalytic domain-containing protein [Candidatus Poribacteria bacterium]MBT7805473.1 alcohol dehydrogenase catalytic domain-containing protein [Candidatus Poribacteria bacterium]